jgi:hypothetical protein
LFLFRILVPRMLIIFISAVTFSSFLHFVSFCSHERLTEESRVKVKCGTVQIFGNDSKIKNPFQEEIKGRPFSPEIFVFSSAVLKRKN